MELHSALKTELIAKTDAAGTQLALVRLIHGRNKSNLTLHANPTSFSTYGLQTTDVLSILGFTRSTCAFMVGGQCYARGIRDDFDLGEFTRVFPVGSQALKDVEKLLLDCGLTIGAEEGWGYFLGKPSARTVRARTAYGDGHTSPKTSKLKEKTDNLFRYVLTFIEGGSDRGWVTHMWPVNPPLSPEHLSVFRLLGLKTFRECPQNDFDPCWWLFTPFERRGDDFFDSNVDVAHKWFDNLETKFAPAVEKITLAHKAFAPFEMPVLSISSTQQYRPSASSATQSSTSTSVTARPKATPRVVGDYEYDVALSYASEDIQYPEQLAGLLQQEGIRVFFDKRYEAELWGKDLYRRLIYIFSSAARYCIVFASQHYAKKLWTNHELRAAQARALEEGEQEYILPIKLDDTEIPGLLPTIKYIDARTMSVEQIADIVTKKLGSQGGDQEAIE